MSSKNKHKVYGLLQVIHTVEDYWTWKIYLSDYPTALLPFATIDTTIRRGSKAEALQDARHIESTLGIIEYKILDPK